MPEPLYQVQFLIRPGAGVRSYWMPWAGHLPLPSAEKLCAIQRAEQPDKVWRVVPAKKVRGRYHRIDSLEKAFSRAIRAQAELPVTIRCGLRTPEVSRDRQGNLVVRLGGHR